MSNQVLIEFVTKFMGLIILDSVLAIAFKVLVMLAIYNDAKAIAVKNKTVYIVLAFFFPLIVGIVYLCTRKTALKEVPKVCNICNTVVAPEFAHCPNCGGVIFTDYLVVNNEKFKKIAKNLLISAIIVCIASFSTSVAVEIESLEFTKKFAEDYSDGSDYDDYFEKFFKEYYGDSDSGDNSDYSENPFSDFGTEDNESDDEEDNSGGNQAEDFNNFGN
ncbi:MAG: hypothetical protein PUG26_06035 [Oscillospiraceae bacterium]|nr:hypothetical protein [Oscillospiraceae bacterium]